MHKILNAIAIIVVVGLLGAAGFGVWILTQAGKLNSDSNAVALVAEMVVEHLRANDDVWPRGWEDLRRVYPVCAKNYDPPPTFEEVQERVCVDWSTTSTFLAKLVSENPTPAVKVIWLCDGSKVHWRGAEPNQFVFNHFTGRVTG
jgi:hypothetical protein